jgi:hypothetical protein
VRQSDTSAGRGPMTAYLSLVVCPIWWVFQCALQSAFIVSAPQQQPYLLCIVLYVGCRHGRDGGHEGAQIKVGGAVRVQGINVDGAPIDGGHGGSCSVLGLGRVWRL